MAHRQVCAVVEGIVQGVGYRAFAVRIARHLGVAGYVRNRLDGRVEIRGEAEEAVLQEFLRHLRQGPAAAVVAGVETEWTDSSGWTAGFAVR